MTKKEWELLGGVSALGMGLAVAMGFRVAYELTHFQIKRCDVESEKIPASFDGAKIVFLTDLHNTEYGKENKTLLQAIKKENPDYIFIGGDMLVARSGVPYKKAISFVRKLAARYPVYYASGNHEYRLKIYPEQYGTSFFDDYMYELEQAGVTYLTNESVAIRRGKDSIVVSGLEIDAIYYSRLKTVEMSEFYIPSLLGIKKDDSFRILLAHNPIYFPEYAKWGADLVLSGHVHGGLVRLPLLGGVVSTQVTLFPKYDEGFFYEGNSGMILSAGLGVHSIPFRLFNLPTMHVITLKKKNKAKLQMSQKEKKKENEDE